MANVDPSSANSTREAAALRFNELLQERERLRVLADPIDKQLIELAVQLMPAPKPSESSESRLAHSSWRFFSGQEVTYIPNKALVGSSVFKPPNVKVIDGMTTVFGCPWDIAHEEGLWVAVSNRPEYFQYIDSYTGPCWKGFSYVTLTHEMIVASADEVASRLSAYPNGRDIEIRILVDYGHEPVPGTGTSKYIAFSAGLSYSQKGVRVGVRAGQNPFPAYWIPERTGTVPPPFQTNQQREVTAKATIIANGRPLIVTYRSTGWQVELQRLRYTLITPF